MECEILVADSFQDILRDRKRLKELNSKMEGRSQEAAKSGLFEEYLNAVDVHLVERGMAFKPAKSVEFGKTDQSMLNHIRNGILFLLRFNKALEKLDARPLDKNGLKECIALFVVHDLHKLKFGEWKQDEDALETLETLENQFEIPEDALKEFIDEVHLRDFAPGLKDEDYLSVAVALHKSRFSRSGARTSRFMDFEPFLYLMDSMASCASPEEAVSARSLTALRDGFPQDSPEDQLNLQYHRLDDVKGILSGIINKSVADVLQEQGLIVLMAYQDGCVYLGKGMQRAAVSEEFIGRVYEALEKNIQNSTPALSNPSRLGDNLNTPRLGYYGLSDEYYFFSGPKTMLRAFIEKSITSAHAEKSAGLTDSMVEGISRCAEVAPIEIENSKEGQKILLGFARAVATVHQSFMSEMISDNKQSLRKTCEIWGVPAGVCDALIDVMERDPTYLANGGKWEYSYAIAQCVMDRKYGDLKLRNMPPMTAIDHIVDLIWHGISQMDRWDEFVSKKTSTYRREMIEYLHDVLTINGTISRLDKSELSDAYKEYELSGKTCNLCNRGTLLNKKQMENSNSFLSFNFTNRVFVGKSKPTNIYTCIPCGVELALRMNGFSLPKGKRSNNEKLYFHFIPDYFFTPESWDLVNTILTKFSDEARVRMAALAERTFDSKYVGSSPEVECDVDVYSSWIKDLAVKDEDEGSKGMSMAQYMAQGYGNVIGNASMIFYKPSDTTTEFHFFGVYIALVIAAYTGMRVVVSQSPITTMRGRDFKEVVALDSVNSHVADFYGKFIPLSKLERTIKSASALIRLGYNTSSGLKDSLFPKYLRVMRDEALPGSYLLKMVYRGSETENTVNYLLEEALFLDELKGDRR
ncbi:MAG: type I-D CRISPR-associated protein Cas10d/Csc3 [Methanothrix sp.]|nr:type I-D CRISPR-associated protein Cas10d/Csc3 [Methanothrix sp.]